MKASLADMFPNLLADERSADVPAEHVTRAMHAQSERWLETHGKHAGQIIILRARPPIVGEGAQILRHFHCNQCSDDFRFQVRV